MGLDKSTTIAQYSHITLSEIETPVLKTSAKIWKQNHWTKLEVMTAWSLAPKVTQSISKIY